MARPPKIWRNKAVVLLKEAGFSYAELGRLFNLDPSDIRAIYLRDKDKYIKKIEESLMVGTEENLSS